MGCAYNLPAMTSHCKIERPTVSHGGWKKALTSSVPRHRQGGPTFTSETSWREARYRHGTNTPPSSAPTVSSCFPGRLRRDTQGSTWPSWKPSIKCLKYLPASVTPLGYGSPSALLLKLHPTAGLTWELCWDALEIPITSL